MNAALKRAPSVVVSLTLPALCLSLMFHWGGAEQAHTLSAGNGVISVLQMGTGGTDGGIISPER